MAATRKAAVAALNRLEVTKAKDDDGGKLHIDDAAVKKLAREYNDADARIKELQEEQGRRKQEIIDLASKKRLEAENEGRYYQTAKIQVDDDESLQVQWADRFQSLDISHEPIIKRVFGKHYDELFCEVFDAKVVRDAAVEELTTAIGQRAFDTLQKFVKIRPALKIKKGFLETRANLRTTFDEVTNTSLDTVLAQVSYAPTVKPMRPKVQE